MKASELLDAYKDGHRSFADASLIRAHLAGANLAGANLTRAHLTGAHLFGANLSEANLTEVDFEDADLRGANLAGANLTRAHLTGAHLRGANLRGANLTDANLAGAHLTDAHLPVAHLTGANLRGANLKGAELRGVVFDTELELLRDVVSLEEVSRVVCAMPDRLNMADWHGDKLWHNGQVLGINECGTTHCLAGWAIHLAALKDASVLTLESRSTPYLIGRLLLGDEVATHFFDTDEEALDYLGVQRKP